MIYNDNNNLKIWFKSCYNVPNVGGGLFELMTNVTLMTLEMLTVNSWEVMHCQSCKHQLRRIRCWLCTGTRTMVDVLKAPVATWWWENLQWLPHTNLPPLHILPLPPIIHLPHLPPRSTCICPAKNSVPSILLQQREVVFSKLKGCNTSCYNHLSIESP